MYKQIKASIKPLITDKELYKKVKAEIKKTLAQAEDKKVYIKKDKSGIYRPDSEESKKLFKKDYVQLKDIAEMQEKGYQVVDNSEK